MGVKKVEKVLELLEVVRRYKYDLLSYWYKPISRSVWRACCLVTIWNLTISLDSLLLDSLYSSTVLLELLTIKNVFLKLEQMSYLFESHQFLRWCHPFVWDASFSQHGPFVSHVDVSLPAAQLDTDLRPSVFNCRGRLTAASQAPSYIGVRVDFGLKFSNL